MEGETFAIDKGDSNRKLASIQRILALNKVENSDNLEIATILGWNVVVRVGEVKLGQLAVYCEIDSMLPNSDWLPEAIQKRIETQNNKDYFRVKTIKLRGALSQGVIVPMPNVVLQEISKQNLNIDECEGMDVTNILQIKKYSIDVDDVVHQRNPRVKVKTFPTDVLDKTEEDRIQSNPKMLKQLLGKPYIISEKHDGTSATYLIHPDSNEFLVCSRNQIRPPNDNPENQPDDSYWKIAKELNIESILRENPDLALQGEICGPSIQKNRLNFKHQRLHIFTIVNIKTRQRLHYDDMINFCKTYKLDVVTLLERGESFPYDNVPILLQKAEGKYPGTKNEREGIVIRSIDGILSFKVISNKYLLAND